MVQMIKYPSGFDYAYKGYQYPLPPSWKYAIRLEDQIQWLLQALLLVNETGVSQAILDAGLAKNLEEAKALVNELNEQLASELRGEMSDLTDILTQAMKELEDDVYADIHNLSDIVDKLKAGISQWISPVVDGLVHYAPYIDKQLFNAARPYLATYGEYDTYFKVSGATYGTATTMLDDYTYYKLALYGAVILGLCKFGDGEAVIARCKPYPINDDIYRPIYPRVIKTWAELKAYGAMTTERS